MTNTEFSYNRTNSGLSAGWTGPHSLCHLPAGLYFVKTLSLKCIHLIVPICLTVEQKNVHYASHFQRLGRDPQVDNGRFHLGPIKGRTLRKFEIHICSTAFIWHLKYVYCFDEEKTGVC